MPCLHITRQIVTQRSVFDTNRACCLLAIDDPTQKLVSEQNDSFRHRPSITHTFRMTALPKILTWFVPTAPETLHAHFLEAPIMPWDSSTSSEIANTRFMHVKRKLVGTLPLITACQTVAILFEKARKLLVDNTA